jgi:predicted DNA-binding transcriptional regulator AlpA
MVPTQLYRHYDSSGTLLYVGISLSAAGRLSQHKQEAVWFDQITRIDVEMCASREEAIAKELLAIRLENPVHNLARPRILGEVLPVIVNSVSDTTRRGNEYLTENEVAGWIHVGARTLQRWRTTGEGPKFVRLGASRVVYRVSDVETWTASLTFMNQAHEMSQFGKKA